MGGSCQAPPQKCPTTASGVVCSGHGSCINRDSSSGNTVSACSTVSPSCTAICKCSGGYGGSDCSLSPTQLSVRAVARSTMCSALMSVLHKSENSTGLLDTVAGTLLSVYRKDELSSTQQLIGCSTVLQYLSRLATRGFLIGSRQSTQQTYAEVSSQ